jgi:4-hydroxy-tetrahydrodipicolinate synthase
MNFVLPSGVWPTMITPYRSDGTVDIEAIQPLVDWYITNGVAGLFAVCQSSEMFFLDREERVALSAAVVTAAEGRCSVIASGHVSDEPEEQIADIEAIAGTGVDAVVLLSNRFTGPNESDGNWLHRAEELLERIDPELPLGMYECPYPYPRLLSLSELSWMSDTGRFRFLKDTSCSEPVLKERARQLSDGPLALYNANSATLLQSLQWGYAGFSGVMANFHPWLYRWLFDNSHSSAEAVQQVQDFLGFASVVEHQCYPVNAKYHLRISGVPIEVSGRTSNARRFDDAMARTIEQMKRLSEEVTRWYT